MYHWLSFDFPSFDQAAIVILPFATLYSLTITYLYF